MHHIRQLVTYPVLIVSALGCRIVTSPVESTREFGVIRYPFLSSLPIFVTETPRVGVPVTVIVNTYGSSSCIRPDGMDVVYSGREVQLTPWDRISRAGACTDDLAAHPHHATLTFAEPGPATITARGYLMEEGGGRRLGVVSISVNVQ
jgi:hypothetical protein